MILSVVIPSYKRPESLARCLIALVLQHRPADQVIVLARDDDASTHNVIGEFKARLPLAAIMVHQPGQVHALNKGFSAVSGEVVTITDDDAAPHANWLAAIERHFSEDPHLGGLGGRDWVHQPNGRVENGREQLVGKVQWFGRIVGNHHLGVGDPREVDVLKGANMSYRCEAVKGVHFDTILRGSGAQAHNDMAFSMAVKRRGWKLVYDPAVAVDHFPAQRADIDQRGVFHPDATENAAFNFMWATQAQLVGWERLATRQWQRLVGSRGAPGWMHFLRESLSRGGHANSRFKAASSGRRLARAMLKGDKA